jgi:hypothetical protein
VADGRARWRPAAAAAGGLISASRRPVLDNKRAWELQGVLVEVGSTRFGGDDGWKVELRVGVHGANGGFARAPCARGEGDRLLKARLGAERRFPGQARHVRGTGHDMEVRTDGVRQRRHWADGVVGATG